MKQFYFMSAALVMTGCAVEVRDETPATLTFNPPINEQTFTVEVDSSSTVKNVEISVDGVGTSPMAELPGDRYEATLPLSACAGVAEFTVDVTSRGLFSDNQDSFPEEGRFVHAIDGQPEACDDFAENVAQTFIVDQTADFIDFQPGDGICQGTNGAVTGCSLRAAVMEANAKPGNDLIRISANRYTLTRFANESGLAVNDSIRDLDITESVTIESLSGTSRDIGEFLTESNDRDENFKDNPDSNFIFAKIDAGRLDRAFQVEGEGTVLQLRNLAIVNGLSAERGGAIFNEGTLVLDRVALADNNVQLDGAAAIGGGAIHNEGIVLANEFSMTHNGVISVANPQGGAIVNEGTMTLRRGLIAYNDARFGNAIKNENDASIALENVTIVDHNGFSGLSPVSILRNDDGGMMALAFVTIANHAIDTRDLLSNGDGVLSIRNVFFANNTADHCVGNVTTLGGNMVDDAVCNATGTTAAMDLDLQDVAIPSFGGLTDEGGFTPVWKFSIPFSSTSTLTNIVDRGRAGPWPLTDQRGEGFPRRIEGDDDGGVWPDPGAWEHPGE